MGEYVQTPIEEASYNSKAETSLTDGAGCDWTYLEVAERYDRNQVDAGSLSTKATQRNCLHNLRIAIFIDEYVSPFWAYDIRQLLASNDEVNESAGKERASTVASQ